MTTAPRSSRKLEIWVGVVLTAIIVCLHAVRLAKAGALWRDEAAAVGLATMSPLKEMVRHFPHEAFPLVVPAAIRGVAWVSGNSDTGFRLFGMVVGVSIIAALWWNLWTIRRSVPLLGLALLGFNSAFITWTDSVRGYGLGTLFIVLTMGLIWQLVQRPTWWRSAGAALAALGSVQCLLHNPPLLLAICLGGIAVALRRQAVRTAALVLLTGVGAAVSLLPYWALLRNARGWDVLVRKPTSVGELWRQLLDTLGASGWSDAWIWVALFVAGLTMALASQSRRVAAGLLAAAEPDLLSGGNAPPAGRPSDVPVSKAPPPMARETPAAGPQPGDRDLLLFSGIALLMAVTGCLCFLKILSYPTRPWYYMAVIGLAAVSLDLIFETLCRQRWARMARLAVALLIAVGSLPLAWRQVQVRQTNVDLVAAKLGQVATREDLIVVYPWHNGISFERYYHGSAAWMTLPPLEFHRFHRYDMVQRQMSGPDVNEALRPLLERMRQTLKSGHRVWIVGNFPAAADALAGRSPEAVISITWSMKAAEFLRASARRLKTVEIGFRGQVNPFEDLPLKVVEGWS